ncbi:hypothetical protein HPB52_019193 [Rhipicephalus sanguineus]|uniref:RING-type domain-containing protein n=1 Tax=Rhipicephalus sanguineus TaxID=34632 RepID=A0A9D4PNX5_RHISA|nr:hypothetical protein HPB52_019193 [Rhipicephalus sanguineus]
MNDSRSGSESPVSSESSSEPSEGYVIVLRGFPGSFLEMREIAFVDPVEPDYICVFCGMVPGTARPLPCRHIVCERCADSGIVVDEERYLTHGNNVTSSRLHALCPVDSTPFDETHLHVEPARLDRVQEELVFCLQANLGCEFMDKLKYLKHHYYYDCCFGPKMCDRCGNDQIPALKLLPHILHCRPRSRRILRRTSQC